MLLHCHCLARKPVKQICVDSVGTTHLHHLQIFANRNQHSNVDAAQLFEVPFSKYSFHLQHAIQSETLGFVDVHASSEHSISTNTCNTNVSLPFRFQFAEKKKGAAKRTRFLSSRLGDCLLARESELTSAL
jgi:hypothetical protein